MAFEFKRSGSKMRLPEILGLDLGASGLKLVRVKKTREGPVVAGAEIMPPFKPAEPVEGESESHRLSLPKNWISKFAAITVTGENAAIRYVSLPGKLEAHPNLDTELREHMGVEGEYRLAYASAGMARKKDAEVRLLTAAVPESEAQQVLSCVSVGMPAAAAIEVAGLAALNGFALYGPLAQRPDDALGFVECGARVTLLALFNKGNLCLVRKFNLGGEALVARIQKQMDVAREVAEGIVSDGSFDVSQAVQDVIDPFLRQLSISKDFVERREGCHISTLFLSGGMSLSRYWTDRLKATAGVDVALWNPLEGIRVAEGALSEEVTAQSARLAAALGAAVGALEAAV